MMPTLKHIEGAKRGYYIGDDGYVYSALASGSAGEIRRLIRGKNSRGYFHNIITLEDGRRKTKMIHLMVLYAYVGPKPSPDFEGCHDDGNTNNNTPGNLYWGTRAQNNAQKKEHGTQAMGESHHMAKVDTAQVVEMRRRNAAGEGYAALARSYGLSNVTVRKICTGRLWAHVPLEAPPPAAPRGNTRLTAERVLEWRRRNAAGEGYAALARESGLNRCVVREACLGLTWSHLPMPAPAEQALSSSG